MANTNKVTKKEMFNAIKAVLRGEETSFTPDEMIAAIDHEIELLNKKSENKKPTKTQAANVGIKAIIAEVLANAEKVEGLTVTEIVASGKFDALTTPQKISALLKQMIDSGEVVRTYEKKVARFSLAPSDDDDDAEDEVDAE